MKVDEAVKVGVNRNSIPEGVEGEETGGGSLEYDVLIVGGGPSGACCAALLAQQGVSVVVCERDEFPRFHVGESLLPRGNRLLERLGILDRCRSAGWTSKPGASFLFEDAIAAMVPINDRPIDSRASPASTAFSSIRFSGALGSAEPEAFQVLRQDFDLLLLERAQELGAIVHQGWRVRSVSFDGDGVEASLQRPEKGRREVVRARFLVDASGQSSLVAKRLQLRQADPALANLASFAHYADWRWPAAVDKGNIQVISQRDLGWLWVIPLSENRVSVGLVEPADGAVRGLDPQQRLAEVLSSSPLLQQQSAQAKRVTRVFRLADFSYGSKAYAGDRWLLIGDAGSFVDPVFSTGVYLALCSGAEAADALIGVLGDRDTRGRSFRRFSRTQRRRYRFFRRFVVKFYSGGMRDLLCQRRDGLQLPAALSAVLAGDWRPRWSVRWRLEAFYLLAFVQQRVELVSRLHLRGGKK